MEWDKRAVRLWQRSAYTAGDSGAILRIRKKSGNSVHYGHNDTRLPGSLYLKRQILCKMHTGRNQKCSFQNLNRTLPIVASLQAFLISLAATFGPQKYTPTSVLAPLSSPAR